MILDKLFAVLPEPLKKYARSYKEGEIVFTHDSFGQETFYILSGNAGVYIDKKCRKQIALVHKAHFFGEMASISSKKKRAASIKAETDLSVLIIPPALFQLILKIDPDTDRNLIKTLSERLQSVDEHLQKNDALSQEF